MSVWPSEEPVRYATEENSLVWSIMVDMIILPIAFMIVITVFIFWPLLENMGWLEDHHLGPYRKHRL